MQSVIARGYGSFPKHMHAIPAKGSRATFSRNSDTDETLEPVKEVCNSHYMQRDGPSVPGMPASGRSPTGWEQSAKATN